MEDLNQMLDAEYTGVPSVDAILQDLLDDNSEGESDSDDNAYDAASHLRVDQPTQLYRTSDRLDVAPPSGYTTIRTGPAQQAAAGHTFDIGSSYKVDKYTPILSTVPELQSDEDLDPDDDEDEVHTPEDELCLDADIVAALPSPSKSGVPFLKCNESTAICGVHAEFGSVLERVPSRREGVAAAAA